MTAMRRMLLSLLLLLAALPAMALRERVYVATDRPVYVAGDVMWMSAWCVDAQTGQLSAFSKTAYVEIHSAEGMVRTAKIALEGGRGAGQVELPGTLPTGNYRILAYTALGAAEAGFDALTGARTISVFNTLSTQRVAGGVEVVDRAPASFTPAAAGPLALEVTPGAEQSRIRISNTGGQTVRFSLSVRHDDGIPAPQDAGIAAFAQAVRRLPAAASGRDAGELEYEGEIIRARVSGTDAAGIRAAQDKVAVLSAPGNGENIYTTAIAADGTATFYTANIFGDRQVFLEIEGLPREDVCHLELVSPYVNFPAGDIPALALCAAYGDALDLRGVAMQVGKAFDADTLYTDLPARLHPVFDERNGKSYLLDDYTRFPVMEELFVEFIPEIRVRRADGKPELQVRRRDLKGNMFYSTRTPLVMLDGVPVPDHARILAYDPLLVRQIDIYPDATYIGILGFEGVINFVTYQGTLPGMQFEDNVRIVDFQGCAWPTAYTCVGVGRDYPDLRQTLYWHPLLTLAPGQTMEVDCKMPLYGGRFEAVAEGLDAAGQAALARAAFGL